MIGRAVTLTIPAEVEPPQWVAHVYVNGHFHGEARVTSDGRNWELVRPGVTEVQEHNTLWALLDEVRQLPEGHIDPYGLSIGLPAAEVQAASDAWAVRVSAPYFRLNVTDNGMAYAAFLAGWEDRGTRDRQVERDDVTREMDR